MNWDSIKKQHIFKEPVEHIYTAELFDRKEYDKLYENMNNLEHPLWTEFDSKYKIPFELYYDIRDINKNKEVICLWFFMDRNDKSSGVDIVLAGKKLRYFHNTFLITQSKDIMILETNPKQYIHRPFVQLDLKESKYKQLLEKGK
tara:strand:+ start:354 stop:788 length:435 start_codon:yes stop_codon:yes gene_type:complete